MAAEVSGSRDKLESFKHRYYFVINFAFILPLPLVEIDFALSLLLSLINRTVHHI